MTAFDAFEAAEKLILERLYQYIREGNEINILNDEGISLLCAVVRSYFRFIDQCYTPEEQQAINALNESTEDDFWDSFLPEERKKPLCDRNIDIQNLLEFMFAHGADPNLVQRVGGFAATPLMIAVCHLDHELTAYLLKHQADPGVRLCSDSTLINGKDYWLMDEMDMLLMHDTRGERALAAARIAGLLYRYGLTEWKGHCIKICKETGEVSFHELRVKF